MTGGMGHPGAQLRSVLPEYEIVIEDDEADGDGDGRSAEERKRCVWVVSLVDGSPGTVVYS